MGTGAKIGSEEYNNEPVYYCKDCLSLKIKDFGIMDYCCDCGSTKIGKTCLEEYDELYLAKYGKKVFFK